MTSLWLFVTPCSTQLLCLLSSAASWSLEPTHGVECVDNNMFSFGAVLLQFYVIHHFGCEYSAITSASCSDTHFSQLTCFIISTLNEVCAAS